MSHSSLPVTTVFLFMTVSFLCFYDYALALPIVEEWVAEYNDSNNDDRANDIAVGKDGSVYVTGQSRGTNTGYDYATVKYDAEGNEVWVKRYHGPGNSDDWANALEVDNSGNVIMRGIARETGHPMTTQRSSMTRMEMNCGLPATTARSTHRKKLTH